MEVGDHLVSPRVGYSHHGIYIGGDQVIHYSGFVNELSAGVIEIASLEDFSNGNAIRIKRYLLRTYSADESVSRAHSRLGEDWYNLLLNNCEHFASWCISGAHSSAQVNSVIRNISNVAASRGLVDGFAGHQTTTAIAQVGSAIGGKSLAGSSAGTIANLVSSGVGIASGSGTKIAMVAGLTAIPAAPVVAGIAVTIGVGYGVKRLIKWIWD